MRRHRSDSGAEEDRSDRCDARARLGRVIGMATFASRNSAMPVRGERGLHAGTAKAVCIGTGATLGAGLLVPPFGGERDPLAGPAPAVAARIWPVLSERAIHLTQAAEDQHWGTRTGLSARVESRAGTDTRAAALSARPCLRSPFPALNLIQMDSPFVRPKAEVSSAARPVPETALVRESRHRVFGSSEAFRDRWRRHSTSGCSPRLH